MSTRTARAARRVLTPRVETVASLRAAEPEAFAQLFERVCAAGTDSKWWFGRAYAFEGGLALLQNPEELAALCLLLRRAPRDVFLEIGSAGGGTCRFLHEQVGFGRVLSIDDGAHPRAAEQETNFAAIGDVVRFVGDSHSPAAAAFLSAEAPGRAIDVALVDGDHSAEGVRQDVRLVLGHLRPGGLLILHDTRECEGVERQWLRLALRRVAIPVAELVGAERPMGIGVARVR